MARTTKLNDLQLILLSTAAQRDDCSLFPPPGCVGDQVSHIGKVIPPLLRRKLVEEVPVTDRSKQWREDGDTLLGLVITEDGRSAIAVGQPGPIAEPASQAETAPEVAEPSAVSDGEKPSQREPRTGTKAEQVLTLLRRPDGATLLELVDATGWLPHTTRAALTGLRKKGHAVAKSKRGDDTRYSITQAAA